MCAYQIQVTRAASRDLRKLPRDVLGRIDRQIQALIDDPRPQGSRKLRNEDELYRVRVGDYRIIYQIRDQELIIVVVRVRHRRDVYDNL